MTSKRVKGLPEIAQPKTKHEEIMNYIESTNDIVSNIQERLEECCKKCFQNCKFGTKGLE